MRIRAVDTADIRFPTSRTLAGSDAMHPDPDYSAAYAVVHVDDPGAPAGHGLAFTIGRGNEIVVAAIEALRSRQHVYMPPDGRINIAGVSESNVDRVADAIVSVLPAE